MLFLTKRLIILLTTSEKEGARADEVVDGNEAPLNEPAAQDQS